MKNIRNSLNNNILLRSIALMTMIFVVNMYSMHMSEQGKKLVKMTIAKQQQQKKQFFIHEMNDKSKGIWIDKEFVENNCKSIKAMIEDFGGELSDIPLSWSIDIIKLGFDLLGNKIDVNHLLVTELISVANMWNFLDVPQDKMSLILEKIKSNIVKDNEENINKQLKELHPDLQKLLMLDPTIDYLKDCIIKKYTKNRTGKTLDSNIGGVLFSFNGKRFVSFEANGLVLWHIADSESITHQALIAHPSMIISVAFSPDDTKIVSGCGGAEKNLILWDISNPNNITHQALVGHPEDVSSVAFSPDGKRVISGCGGAENNLILWDISNPDNITSQELVGHPDGIFSVAFSPTGKNIVSNSRSLKDSLILWDITNPNNITPLILEHKYVISAAFNADGTKIAAAGGDVGDKNNFRLWDISNPDNITYLYLVGLPDSIVTVAFSHDSKRMVAGYWNTNDTTDLILWNISNPNNMTYQKLLGQLHSVTKVAFSPDGIKILSVGGSAGEFKLMLTSLLTDQEEILLKGLKNYTVDQVRLIYMFCLKSSKNETVSLKEGSEQHTIFKTLPESMQKLLNDLFLSKGWFSGWW